MSSAIAEEKRIYVIVAETVQTDLLGLISVGKALFESLYTATE